MNTTTDNSVEALASGNTMIPTTSTTSDPVVAMASGEPTFGAIEPTTIPAWQRYQDGDEAASAEVLSELDETINKAISAYANGDPQMKTQARIMALDAVKTYDPNRGAQLSTYVYGQLQRLRRESAQRGNITKVSENVALERAQIERQIREYVADNGEEPTTEQLADLTGLSVKRIDAVMNYKPVVPDSAVTSPEGDTIPASEVDRALELYDRMIYDELDDIDKKIYEWTTGYGKGKVLSQVEIARRLGITPAAVSKRYKRIVEKFGQDREIIRQSIGASVA